MKSHKGLHPIRRGVPKHSGQKRPSPGLAGAGNPSRAERRSAPGRAPLAPTRKPHKDNFAAKKVGLQPTDNQSLIQYRQFFVDCSGAKRLTSPEAAAHPRSATASEATGGPVEVVNTLFTRAAGAFLLL